MAKERDISKDYAELLDLTVDERLRFKTDKYDKCLHIVLYGTPFTDSRPKANMRTGGIALKNQEKMKKVFKVLYNKTGLLPNLTILSQYRMQALFYVKPTQDDLKFIKNANASIKKAYEKEKLYFMGVRDVDNMVKIHNDILLFPEFRIVIDDAGNVDVDARKYLSQNERADIRIYFSTKPSSYYSWKVQTNKHYFRWLISEKHMRMNNRTSQGQFKHLRKTIMAYIYNKPEADIVKTLRSAIDVLEEYPAVLIKEIAGYGADNKYTKDDAYSKLMITLTKGNKLAEKIVNRSLGQSRGGLTSHE